jgi:hypothetical protein
MLLVKTPTTAVAFHHPGFYPGLTKKGAPSRVGDGDKMSFTRFSAPSKTFLVSPMFRSVRHRPGVDGGENTTKAVSNRAIEVTPFPTIENKAVTSVALNNGGGFP